ncbi:MAG: hypothetical protein LIP09_07400 [Bacteroidales bacterium]|nr:hypothetical protein [Bacteroidales bacterium]
MEKRDIRRFNNQLNELAQDCYEFLQSIKEIVEDGETLYRYDGDANEDMYESYLMDCADWYVKYESLKEWFEQAKGELDKMEDWLNSYLDTNPTKAQIDRYFYPLLIPYNGKVAKDMIYLCTCIDVFKQLQGELDGTWLPFDEDYTLPSAIKLIVKNVPNYEPYCVTLNILCGNAHNMKEEFYDVAKTFVAVLLLMWDYSNMVDGLLATCGIDLNTLQEECKVMLKPMPLLQDFNQRAKDIAPYVGTIDLAKTYLKKLGYTPDLPFKIQYVEDVEKLGVPVEKEKTNYFATPMEKSEGIKKAVRDVLSQYPDADTERAFKYIVRAIQEQQKYMYFRLDGKGLVWHYGNNPLATLGFFLYKVYPDTPRPQQSLKNLIELRNAKGDVISPPKDFSSAIAQQENNKEPKRGDVVRWRAEIDKDIFFD